MSDPAIIARHDGVTRDPVLEERIERVWALAKTDIERDAGPRTLTGDLIGLEDEYEARYTELQIEAFAALETN